MTPKEYEAFVMQRCKGYVDINYCVIALNGEAGEVAEWYKKYELRGQQDKLTLTDLLYELGDTLFYLVRLARLHGWNLSDVMEANMTKLAKREAAGVAGANG